MKAVIFDVDGTLWDSTEMVATSWRKTCEARGIPCSHITGERLKREFGKLLRDIGLSVFAGLPEDEALRLTEICCEEENAFLLLNSPDCYEGVPELFRVLSQEMPIFIVSNCQAGYIEAFLACTGLGPYVTGHLCPGDTGRAKAENIREILRRHHLTDAAYVGDTAGDAASARAAGVAFIYASYGFGEVENPAETISRPLELLRLTKTPLPVREV